MANSYATEHGGHVLLGDGLIEASIDTGSTAGLIGLTNKITGRAHKLKDRREAALRFQTDAHCSWIRDWRFKMGSGEAVEPCVELGYVQGFHKPETSDADWSGVSLINDFPISPAGYSAVLYPGYAWYRARFDLPADAKGKPIEIVAGGTDDQDWLDYRFYVNGIAAGEASPRTHWHPAPKAVIGPDDPAYASLHFGESNLLAVQARGLDRSFPGMRMSDSERYTVGAWLVDQRVSVGPLESEVSDFRLVDHSATTQSGVAEVILNLVNDAEYVALRVRYWIDGDEPVVHKQVTVTNTGAADRTLLEADIAGFEVDAEVSSGGLGVPCNIGVDTFCGVRHPSGVAQGQDRAVRLTLYPGKKLAPGESYEAKPALFGVGKTAGDAFIGYLQRHGHRKREVLNMMHAYGMHDLASMANPVSLTEGMVLKTLDVLEDYQKRGAKFDWYWIDAGWYNPVGDLTDFDPAYFPNGPAKVYERIKDLGMQVGLWTSPVRGPMAFHDGKGITNPHISEPGCMCLAEGSWLGTYRDALLHHVRKSNVRGLKFDGVVFVCNHPGHKHLPGKYSVEPTVDGIVGIMEEVRRECPEVFYMLYWNVRSPWWLLWGDTIYERGVLMEGATPCDEPSALMRQSVTVSLDQATHHAWDSIPLECGDSLGVWISEWRWGSYLKTEWWQGGWIMDIARGSLLCQLWGDITMFGEHDAEFLAHISNWMREHSDRLLPKPTKILGDPWNGDPYGYAYLDGGKGAVFAFNPTFEPKDVVLPLGDSASGRSAVKTVYPMGDDQAHAVAGKTLSLRLRPFEVRMLQIDPTDEAVLATFPVSIGGETSIPLDCALKTVSVEPLSWDDDKAKPAIRRALNGRVGMADEGDNYNIGILHDERDEHIVRSVLQGDAVLPPTKQDMSLLIVVRLSREGTYWHHRGLYNVIKAAVSIDGSEVEVTSMPHRWHEQAGMWSWILFRAPVAHADHARTAALRIETCLPQDVDCEVSALLFSE